MSVKKFADKIALLVFVLHIALTQIVFPQNVKFEHISINDGLSQGSVRTIFNDSNGNMWFGTNDGLNRYDGYRFKIYKNDLTDTNSISNNYIHSIAEDELSNLWIGTNQGINCYDRKKNMFRQYVLSKYFTDIKQSDEVFSIVTGKDEFRNHVWFASRSGLYEINISNGELNRYNFHNLSKSFAKVIYDFDVNNLLVGMYDGSIVKFNKVTKLSERIQFVERHKTEVIEFINTIHKDIQNNFWIGSNVGLYVLRANNHSITPFSIRNDAIKSNELYINSLTVDNDSNLWIATAGNGLVKLNTKSNKTDVFVNDPNNPFTVSLNNLLSVFHDKTNLIWIGTNGNGIDRFNIFNNNFKLFTKTKLGLSYQSIRAIYKDSQKNIYIGGYGPLTKYNPQASSYTEYAVSRDPVLGMSGSSIYSMIADRNEPNKILWIGTEGSKLHKLDLNSNLVYKNPFKNYLQDNKAGNSIYSMFDDSQGNLWLGTENGLIIINKSNGKYEHYSHNSQINGSIGPQRVTAIFHDSKGNKWIGTDISGLNLFENSSKTFVKYLFNFKDSTSISNNSIKSIYEDKKGRLWIGTDGGGLNQYNYSSNSFNRITTKDGLPNNVIYGILEDEDGNLWLSTNIGLCKFNPDKKTFTNYNVTDGLQSNEFNSSAYYKSADGELFFGGIKGLNSFYPSELIVNNNPPKVVITELLLFNSVIPIGKEINQRIILNENISNASIVELNYDENVISIEFAALDFVSPLKNKFSYKLEGFDSKWTNPNKEHKATYTNLYPGKYVFKVRGANNDGVWSKEYAQITIIINPPFWNTWWFKLLIIFTGISAIALIYRSRVKTIKTQNERLEKVVAERTSELEQLYHDLLKSENELKEINSNKDRFLSILAHDLKGPFIGVIGLSEILLSDLDELNKNEIKEISADINLALNEQYILLENLLDWSRIQINKIEIQFTRMNVNLIVGKVIRFLINNAKSKNITIINDVPEKLFVNADPTMVRTILQNLIANAIKFSNENSEIIIRAKETNNFVKVEVEDKGVGIDDNALQKIFRDDVIHTTLGTAKEEGTGLGLMLVKELVKKQNGEITVESKIGEGSKFIFTLQLCEQEDGNLNS